MIQIETDKEIKELLKNRGSIYGNYTSGIDLRATILNAIFTEYQYNHDGEDMPERSKQHMFDIVNKLIRLAVTPTHEDSWLDIIGYTTLILEGLQNEVKESG